MNLLAGAGNIAENLPTDAIKVSHVWMAKRICPDEPPVGIIIHWGLRIDGSGLG